jgi:hypothetical protein
MDFAQITALAALAVVVVQQILKLNVIPIYIANKYPVLTNVLLSLVASVVVTFQTAAVNLVTFLDYVVYVGLVSVLAAIVYNMTLRNSDGVQAASNKVE